VHREVHREVNKKGARPYAKPLERTCRNRPVIYNLPSVIVAEILIPTLQTRRLLLRPLELDDAPQVQALFPHWEIVRFLQKIVPWPYPPDGAYTWCREFALPAMAPRRGMALDLAPEKFTGLHDRMHHPEEQRQQQ
jgi:GNAT acetyltransferase-like protein